MCIRDRPCYSAVEDPLYKSIPFFMSSYRYGIFLDNTYKTTKNKPLAPDVSLKVIAQRTAGFAGADLETLVNEAALLAARRSRKAITMEAVSYTHLNKAVWQYVNQFAEFNRYTNSPVANYHGVII